MLWLLLVVLSLIPLFPLTNFVGHPHWETIRWIPFQDYSFTKNFLIDIVGNIGWFIVFGCLLHYVLTEDSSSFRSIVKVVLITAGVSLSIEFFQVFCHHRTPSMTDVVCNTAGAGLGAYLSKRYRFAVFSKSIPYRGVKEDGSKVLFGKS